MKTNLWKLVTVVFVLIILVPGLMLPTGCGPEKVEATPTPVPMKPTATPMSVAPPTSAPTPAAPPTDTPAPVQTGGPVPPPAGLIDDFEGGDFDGRWWSFTDENTVSFTCTLDQPGYASEQAMRLTFEVGAGSWPGCGMDVDPGQWGDASGLSFFWRADQPGLEAIVILSMEDPTQTYPDSKGVTPFEAVLQTPGEEWTPVTLAWDDLAKAEWVGESGASLLDPTRVVALIFQANEAQSGSVWVDDLQLVTGPVAAPGPATPEPTVPPAPPPLEPGIDKWSLWAAGTQLRGANIWQRVVLPWVDGDEFLGDGHVGPPFVQEDLDRLAAMGANYVNISGPGLFTERPPYVLDEAVAAHLDNLLAMAAQADLFVVITARTGPGRSDFTFYWDESADWGDASLLNDDVWLKQDAQDAWVEMWRYTAERYRDNPVVVGYDLMCEPNGPGRLLEIWNGEDFYPAYAGTLYDWNQLYPRIVQAIREVDPDTPILVSAMGSGSVRWLPFLEPVDDPRTVYMVHQYESTDYTFQEPPAPNTYPGEIDLDWDGAPDAFDRAWLDGYLSIIDDFKARYGAPVAVNEFGVMRWLPGAADFMRDSMDLFEQRGMNHAFWAWNPLWLPYAHIDGMNYLRGPDPDDHTDLATSDLIDVITKYWGRNTTRPSNVPESTAGQTTPAQVAPPSAPTTDQPTPPLAPSNITQVWANQGGDKVTRDELRATNDPNAVHNSVWNGTSISLFGARNEVVSFNLLLEAAKTDATNVNVTLTELTGPDGATINTRPASGDDVFNYVGRTIELFYMRYLEIKGLSTDLFYAGYDYDERHVPERCRRPYDEETGEGTGTWGDRPCHNKFYPEIAVPLELHAPFTIAAGTNQSIWGDIYIPKTVPAGLYTGIIAITEDGALTRQVPINLYVRDFALPDLPNARTMLAYSPENINDRYLGEDNAYPEPGTAAYIQSLELVNRHFQLAHHHKISLIDGDASIEQLDDAWTARLNGELFTLTKGYDGVGAGVGNNVYSIGTYGSWSWQDGTQEDMWANTDAWINWFDAQAFATPTDYFLYLIDESDDYPQTEQWAQWIEENPGPGQRLMSMATIGLPTAAAETPSLDVPTSWYSVGLTDVWQNAVDSYAANPDKRFYMYNSNRPGSGSFAIEDEGVALRELAWGQYKMGIDRWFYWESTYCNNEQGNTGQTNVFQQAQTYGDLDGFDKVLGETGWNYLNGDGVLFYPGTDTRFPEDSYGVMGPFASLRLKHWRRGIQDVDYLKLAAEIAPERTAEIVNEIVPTVLWEVGVNDPEDPTWVLTDISWSTDPDVWEAARAELADIIEGASP